MRRLLVLVLGLLPSAVVASVQTLVIDQLHSHVNVAVKATVGSFVGELWDYETNVTFDPDKHSIERVDFRFHFKDLKTGDISRDKDMLEWAETTKYPDGHFVLTALQPSMGGKFQARGTITLHGKSKEIVFPVTINQNHDRYTMEGEAVLDTRDFGLPILRRYWLLTVDPIVRVGFYLEGNRGGH